MEAYKITAELNLKKIIAESKEVAQALNEFADNLERIEKKYNADTIPWTTVHEAQMVQRQMME